MRRGGPKHVGREPILSGPAPEAHPVFRGDGLRSNPTGDPRSAQAMALPQAGRGRVTIRLEGTAAGGTALLPITSAR
jgi:hypothetical protein